MQQAGGQNLAEQKLLLDAGFEPYGTWDAIIDWRSSHEQLVAKGKYLGQSTSGGMAAIGGAMLASGTAGLCLGTGAGCLLTPLAVPLGGYLYAEGAKQYFEASGKFSSPYAYRESPEVQASFGPGYAPSFEFWKEDAWDLGFAAIDLSIGKLGGKVFDAAMSGKLPSSAKAGASEIPGAGKNLVGAGSKQPWNMPSALPENLTGYANPKDIQFSQKSIANAFRDGRGLESTINNLRLGKVSPDEIPPIRVFERDGLVYTLDNRRLFVASQAGVPVRVVPATPAEIARESGRKMSTPNQGKIICIRGKCE
jgi:filamentous hemagglutinin